MLLFTCPCLSATSCKQTCVYAIRVQASACSNCGLIAAQVTPCQEVCDHSARLQPNPLPTTAVKRCTLHPSCCQPPNRACTRQMLGVCFPESISRMAKPPYLHGRSRFVALSSILNIHSTTHPANYSVSCCCINTASRLTWVCLSLLNYLAPSPCVKNTYTHAHMQPLLLLTEAFPGVPHHSPATRSHGEQTALMPDHKPARLPTTISIC